jgi:hypothetical protein
MCCVVFQEETSISFSVSSGRALVAQRGGHQPQAVDAKSKCSASSTLGWTNLPDMY